MMMKNVHEHYNFTSFITDYVLTRNKEGQNILIGVLKASFDFGHDGVLTIASRERMVPVTRTDAHYGNPETTSV